MAASVRRTVGPIPIAAYRSPISPTAACRTHGTHGGSTSSPTSRIRRSDKRPLLLRRETVEERRFRLDHFRPLGDFRLDEGAEPFLGRIGGDLVAAFVQPR